MRLRAAAVCLIGLYAVQHASNACAQSVEQFYSGRQLRLQIGNAAGSVYDLYGRLVSRHLGNHIPGRPRIIAVNTPGATSLVLANALANISPRDGSVIGTVFDRVPLEPLIGTSSAQFDGRSFAWLGSVLKTTEVCIIWHTARAKTIEDARQYETIVGTAGTAGGSAISSLVLNDIAGTKFKLVSGYSGTELSLAMERGETQARCMSWGGLKASKPDWLRDGKVNVVVQMAMQKHPELSAVPLVTEFASKPDELAALEFMYATQEMGRPFLAPPGVPADRIAALRRAFDELASDPAFLEDARRSNLEVSPIPGLRVQQIIEHLYETPKSAIARVERWRAAQ